MMEEKRIIIDYFITKKKIELISLKMDSILKLASLIDYIVHFFSIKIHFNRLLYTKSSAGAVQIL